MYLRTMALLVLTALLATPAAAKDSKYHSHRCKPVGTWLINVAFPGSELRFQELLVLNADRTLQETNTALHPNTNPLFVPENTPPTTGSDGFGTWKRQSRCRVAYSILKFVFAGDPGIPPMSMMNNGPPLPPPGAPIGFFKVTGVAKIVGDMFMTEEGDVTAEIILGPNPFDPEAIRIDAGQSVSTGVRLYATD